MLKDYQLFLVSGVKRARSSRAADSSPLPLIRYGTKILNLKTQEIGLLIRIWKNKFANGEIDCLGFLPRSQNFVFKTFGFTKLNLFAIRHKCRTEIRFATCVDKQGKKYNIELDNIRVVEVGFEK